MFVRKIKSNKGIIEVGRYGVDRIDVHDDGSATYYTAGGNIFTVKVKKFLMMMVLYLIQKIIIRTYTDVQMREKLWKNFYRIT